MATAYFMLPVTQVLNTAETYKTTGRPGTSATLEADCTDDSLGAVTGFSGSAIEGYVVVVNPSDYRQDRLQKFIWVGTSRPPAGKELTALTSVGDDTCVQGGVTYQRYSCVYT